MVFGFASLLAHSFHGFFRLDSVIDSSNAGENVCHVLGAMNTASEDQNDSESDKKPFLQPQSSDTAIHVAAKLNRSKSIALSSGATAKRASYSVRKNRRDCRRAYSDRWNRKCLGLLPILFVLVIYMFFANQSGNEQSPTTPLVNVPPQDESVPGPKGKARIESVCDVTRN